MTDATPRAWQRMLSGRRLNLLDPSPLDVEVEDIALGLSRVARWNGQTTGAYPFTVAQHSLVVLALVEAIKPLPARLMRLAALLHDASEYVTSDLITPFKAAVGPGYKEVERRIEGAVHVRFGLPPTLPEEWRRQIKQADKDAAFLEAVQLAGFSVEEARKVLGYRRKPQAMTIAATDPETARLQFLAAFQRLVQA
ncbi:MAG: HD family hydrolase [Alphaproteobacteria bacterium]|nr:HD family hydrolase [Alphaproteobacteria bacterium]TAD90580.1 MAG: HD family hydrolase [Alphaproteobacteria bacterium]